MKIVVTYEAADILRLVCQDLTRQGLVIAHGAPSIRRTEQDEVFVALEVTHATELPPDPPEAPNAPPAGDAEDPPSTRDAPTPFLTNPYHPRTERTLIEGESFDYPGAQTR